MTEPSLQNVGILGVHMYLNCRVEHTFKIFIHSYLNASQVFKVDCLHGFDYAMNWIYGEVECLHTCVYNAVEDSAVICP